MPAPARSVVAVLACVALSACTDPTGTSSGGDCVSHYDHVVRASTWHGLEEAILRSRSGDRLTSLRAEAAGHELGAGDKDVVRVVEVLDRDGHRRAHLDVWRTPSGGWRAGTWGQCID